jgi:predicted O-methyltransferase YrrM
MTGYDLLPRICTIATNDIRHHLWSIYWLARNAPGRILIELGVRSGDSTRALLAAAKDADKHVVSYDQDGDAYDVRKVTENHGIPWSEFDGLWNCHRSDSVKAADQWLNRQLGFVFVDTNHDYDLTSRELAAWSPLIMLGGLIVLHDTTDAEPDRLQVTPACVDFVAREGVFWTFENLPHIGEGDTGLGWLRRIS